MEIRMDKPKLQTKSYYDYNDCCQYLQKKYKFNANDYYGVNSYIKECLDRVFDEFGKEWYTTIPADFTPQQKAASEKYSELLKQQPKKACFWDYVIDNNDISNGCDITFSRERLNYAKSKMQDWQIKIYEYFLDEFADENGELTLYISW